MLFPEWKIRQGRNDSIIEKKTEKCYRNLKSEKCKKLV
jgi:hypothetical protein